MITEKDLREAIAECEGERKPGASTCVKLAAFYAVKDRLYPGAGAADSRHPSPAYMDAGLPAPEGVLRYDSGSEFSRLVDGRMPGDVLPVMDELMDALMAVNPRLYAFALRKLREGR